jgi:O-antigen ligase
MTWMERKNALRLISTGIYTSLLLCLLIVSSLALPRTAQRMSSLSTEMVSAQQGQPDIAEKQKSKSSSALRKLTWSVAVELWWEHPFGVGVGQMADAMVAKYKERGETYAAERRLPAHNQFLQTGAEFGWPGFILLIAFLVILTRIILSRKEVVSTIFLVLVWFNFLIESCLEAQAGIVWFCFWSGVFIVHQAALDGDADQ